MRTRWGARLGGVLLVAVVVQALGCAGTRPGSNAEELPLQLAQRQLIVAIPLVSPAARSDEARRLAAHYDLDLVGAFPLVSIDVHCVVFEVPQGRDVDGVARELAAHPGVRLVQGNHRFEGLGAAYSDPYASLQHGAELLHAAEAHRWATGKGVRVAIVDTGVDTTHPDLAGRIVERRSFVEGGERHFDRDAHGTAVAGIIAARADNGLGIYGIAPDAELVVAKACWHADPADGAALCSSWTLARAVDFAIEANVRVLNLSLAGPDDELLTRLLGAAAEAGILIAAAAGEDDRPRFPASLGFVIAVVASDVTGGVPPGRWSGKIPALAAPGIEILTTAPGARYHFLSGSSLSTAHVSGAAALLFERDPTLSPDAILEILEATARRDVGPPARAGVVDACAALRRLSGGKACP